MLLWAAATVPHAEVWSAATDYSITENPNGAWSYGRKWSPTVSAIDLMPVRWGDSGWYLGNWGHGGPSIQGYVNMWAKDNSNGLPALRWTAPRVGTYSVDIEFTGNDSRGVDVYAFVIVNSVEMFSQRILGSGSLAHYSAQNIAMNSGDTIDLVVQWGGSVYYEYNWTLVSATVTDFAQPEVALASSSFDGDAEGWVVEDFVETFYGSGSFGNPPVTVGSYSPGYGPSGGNPDGYITMTDPSENWFWFSAPITFLGDKSAAFGGSISLDMRIHPDPGTIGTVFPMVILVGGGNTLFAITDFPGDVFSQFEIPLTPCAWRVGNYATGQSPSATELLAVLGDLDALYISGDWVDGTETADLDNVGVYSPSAPSVCVALPDQGPNTGVSGVVITGTGFFGALAVHFGSNPASFTVDSDTQITIDLGSTSTVGFVDVSVTTSQGTGKLTNGFDYFVPPEAIGTPCGAPYLTWSGSPTLGETFTVTTANIGSHNQLLLIDWSNIPNPKFAPYLSNCRVLVQPDGIVPLGNNPSHNISIPQDVGLLGVHLRIQSLVRARPSVMTQALDALIGE